MDAIIYFSLRDHPTLLYFFSVLTIVLALAGFGMMLKFYMFFKESKEFELSIIISRYYLYASFIYLTTGLFGIGGMFHYATSIDDIAYIIRPFVLGAVLFAGWRLFYYFKHINK